MQHRSLADFIQEINEKVFVTDEELVALKLTSGATNARDRFSSVESEEDLISYAKEIHDPIQVEEITKALKKRRLSRSKALSALRWMCRNLNPEKALQKVDADSREISKLILKTKNDSLVMKKTKKNNESQNSLDFSGSETVLSAGIEHIKPFSYEQKHILAIQHPFSMALGMLTDQSDPGSRLFAHGAPTGLGKTNALIDATLLAVADLIDKKIQPRSSNGVNYILVAAPSHALLEQIHNGFVKKSQVPNYKSKYRAGFDYEVISLKSNLDELIEPKKDEDSISQANLPEDCPITQSSDSSEYIKTIEFINQKLRPGNDNSDAMEKWSEIRPKIDMECSKVWESSADLPLACTKCKLRNPGGAAFHRSGDRPLNRVIFITVQKLMYGLRYIRKENGFMEKISFSVMNPVEKKSIDVESDSIVNGSFPPGVIFIEEAVQCYAAIKKMMIEQNDIRLIRYSNQVAKEHEVSRLFVERIYEQLHAAQDVDFSKKIGLKIAKVVNNAERKFRSAIKDFYLETHGVNDNVSNGLHFPYRNHTQPDYISLFPDPLSPPDISQKLLYAVDSTFYALSSTKQPLYRTPPSGLGSRSFVGFISHNSNKEDQYSVVTAAIALDKSVVRPAAWLWLEIEAGIKQILEKAKNPLEKSDSPKNKALNEISRIVNQGKKHWAKDLLGIEVDVDINERRVRNARDARACYGDGDGDYLDAAEKVYLAGQTVLKIDHNSAGQTYELNLQATQGLPEKVLINLLSAGSNVCLISATMEYENPLDTFNFEFLKSQGYAPHRQADSVDADLESMIAHKYSERSQQGLVVFNDVYINKTDRGVAGWVVDEKSIVGNKNLENIVRICNSKSVAYEANAGEQNSSAKHHPLSCIAQFLADVLSEPTRPRYVIALVNSNKEAKKVQDILMNKENQALTKFFKSTGANLDIKCIALTSKAAREGNPENDQLQEIKRGFVNAVTAPDGKKVPISIIISPKSSLGVGANLQLEVPLNKLDGGSITPLLQSYIGSEKVLRGYENAKTIEIDASDLMFCLPLTMVFPEQDNVQNFLTLVSLGKVDPYLVRNALNWTAKESVSFLKKYPIYGDATCMQIEQGAGRGDRTLNNPKSQKLWLHQDTANFIAAAHEPIREDGKAVLQTPSWRSVLNELRDAAFNKMFICPERPTSAEIKSVVISLLSPEIQQTLSVEALNNDRLTWESIRVMALTCQGMSDASFKKSPEILNATTRLEASKESNPNIELDQISHLYMKVPMWALQFSSSTRNSVFDVDAVENRELITASAYIARDDRRIYMGQSKASIPAPLRESARLGRWKIYDPEIMDALKHSSKATFQGENLEKIDGDEPDIYLMRPAVMTEVSIPAVDEQKTAHMLKSLKGCTYEEMPIGVFERDGDHYLSKPGLLIDNKSFSSDSPFMKLENGDLNKLIDAGRRKINHAKTELPLHGLPAPTMMLYIFRNPPTEGVAKNIRKSSKAYIVGVSLGSYEMVDPFTNENFDILIAVMPRDFKKYDLAHVVKPARNRERNLSLQNIASDNQ